MRLLKWFLICFTVLLPLMVQAQPGQDWRVVVYENATGMAGIGGVLDVLGPTGIVARYALPAAIYPASNPNAYPQIVVSPDRRYAAIAFSSDGNGAAPPISIIDLTANSCCVTVSLPLANVQGYSLSGFNAQSTQLALSYVAFVDPNAFSPDGGLVVVDAASGNVVSSASMAQLSAAISAPSYFAFANAGAWTPQGIRFVPSCWACDGIAEANWYTWDPSTNLVGSVNNAYFTAFGDVLPVTNELLYSINNTSYPSGPADGMFPPANVVEYFQNGIPMASQGGQQTNGASAPIVYYDPNNPAIPQAHWIANGAAFVVQGNEVSPTATIVFRNQGRTSTAFGPTDHFIVGTPDGWLAQDAANNINHYVVNGSAPIAVSSLGQFAPNTHAVWSTPLGIPGQPPITLIAGAPFVPTIAPPPQLATPTIPPPPNQAMACPGGPQPRLQVGHQGRVTPGTPNNLRSAPTLNAALLGQIPAGGVFSVLAGPVCSNALDNINWWQVNYNGRQGFTAEGKGGEYWVEPLG